MNLAHNINKSMKKLSDILNEASVQPDGEKPSVEVTSRLETALSYVSQISEMADEIYNTLDELPGVDEKIYLSLEKAYVAVDEAYTATDETYDIEPIDYEIFDGIVSEDEIKESLNEVSAFTYMHSAELKKRGFRVAPTNAVKTNSKIVSLYGIPMRAGKWADFFVGITDDKVKPWSIIIVKSNETKEHMYDSAAALFKDLQNHIDNRKPLTESLIDLSVAGKLATTSLITRDAAASYLNILRRLESGQTLSSSETKLLVATTAKLVDVIVA